LCVFSNSSEIFLHHLCVKVLLAAVISLALGLFQDFGSPLPSDTLPARWVGGVAIMIAVLIVVSRVSYLPRI